MRAIKFRGRNAHGEWLYGYYVVNRGEHFICPDEFVNPHTDPSKYSIDPKTLGQFTGLYTPKLEDKQTLVEVYEGDILRFDERDPRDSFTAPIEFRAGAFQYTYKGHSFYIPSYYFEEDGCKVLVDCIVIGNIHTAPPPPFLPRKSFPRNDWRG